MQATSSVAEAAIERATRNRVGRSGVKRGGGQTACHDKFLRPVKGNRPSAATGPPSGPAEEDVWNIHRGDPDLRHGFRHDNGHCGPRSAAAADPCTIAGAVNAPAAIEPKVLDILRATCKALADAKTMSFTAVNTYEKAALNGQPLYYPRATS